MAAGVAALMCADAAVATTGVGGPGPVEGKPAGTVFIAVWCRGRSTVSKHRFDGEPAAVVEQATRAALDALRDALRTGCPQLRAAARDDGRQRSVE
jgi:nicotinamide-nucleotide amidase